MSRTELLGVSGAVASIVGLTITLWLNAGPWIYALCVSILLNALFGILFLRQKRMLDRLSSYVQREGRLRREMFALYNYLVADPVTDKVHFYEARDEEYEYSGSGITFHWTLRGVNASNVDSHGIEVKIANDSPAEYSQLDISCRDNLTGKHLDRGDLHLIRDDRYLKVFLVPFAPALAPEGRFDISFICHWPGNEPLDGYVFFPWGEYCKAGIGTLRGRFVSPLPISEARVWVWSGDALIEERSPEIRTRSEPGGIRYFVELTVVRPSQIYVIDYELAG